MVVDRSTLGVFFFFFKQKTAYEMRISDWSSDVCSSDLRPGEGAVEGVGHRHAVRGAGPVVLDGDGEADGLAGTDRRVVGVLLDDDRQIGRASCRARVCQDV